MKKLFYLFIFLSIVLAACGPTSKSPKPTQTPTASTTPPPATMTPVPQATATHAITIAYDKIAPANNATDQATTVTLSWEKSLHASSYLYCIDTSDNNKCSTKWISADNNTSVTLNDLKPGTRYYWQVHTKSTEGSTYANGSDSAWWSFTVTLLPGAFNELGPANGTTDGASSPTLSWEASSNAREYLYCIDTSNNNKCNTSWISAGTATNIPLLDLKPGARYYWLVRARNNKGFTYANQNSTDWWSFTIAP